MLFNIAMDEFPVMEDKGIIKNAKISNECMYADDLTFIATTQKKKQIMWDKALTRMKKWNLEPDLSKGKTELMIVNPATVAGIL